MSGPESQRMPHRILVLNSGSTSLKAGVYEAGPGFLGERAVLNASASGLGSDAGTLEVTDASGGVLLRTKHAAATPEEALSKIAEALREHGGTDSIAVGHRVVHGGPRLRRHTRITPAVLAMLRSAIHFAPLHLPASLALIEAATRTFSEVPQYACFDTAFHATMPPEATRLAIPAQFAEAGVERYGFHGLSYESIVDTLRSRPDPLPIRIVCAHLGGGSSLCAIHRGRSIDTTMGLSPSGGIPMATRSGDLDPEVIIFLARSGRLSLDALERTVNKESGLVGICGESDMQKLEQKLSEDPARDGSAGLAFRIFTTAIAKQVAALTVSLGGLDLLVFTGGIGEHSARVRAAVLAGLTPFGVRMDAAANQAHAPRISAAASRLAVEIIPAQEDARIAAHVRTLLLD